MFYYLIFIIGKFLIRFRCLIKDILIIYKIVFKFFRFMDENGIFIFDELIID